MKRAPAAPTRRPAPTPDGSSLAHPLTVVVALVISSPAWATALRGGSGYPEAMLVLLVALVLCGVVAHVVRTLAVGAAAKGREARVAAARDEAVVGWDEEGQAPAPGVRGDGPPRRKADRGGRRQDDLPRQRSGS